MNAKEEFLKHTQSKTVKCARIQIEDYPWANLMPEYTPEDFDAFLASINVKYNDGYGTQELCGTIWYADGTWSTRWEYDGSEGWEYHKCPEISFITV
jgi:hypothetical protein